MAENGVQRRLGDFEILRELGRGGMGIVYEARQVSLNRKVALKVLAGSLGITPTAVLRFRREAEAAAKLHHTNIVPVYGIGEQDGTHFYAMELIDGPSLNLVVARMRNAALAEIGGDGHAGATSNQSSIAAEVPAWVEQTITHQSAPISEPARIRAASDTSAGESSTTLSPDGNYFDTVARMLSEVADALDYAHNEGVIHRDMKPSNLLLSPTGRVSINDFGLARMLEQPGMTTTGEFVGSPLYMSPEQLMAGRAPLDHRTDIYSLGATLYELLTLQPPFPGERWDQIIAQIIHKEPAPLRRLNKKIPLDLETICLKALEKDPDRRYQTGKQFADDLRRFVNRHAISARRIGLMGRAVRWSRRHRAVSGALACAAMLAVVAGVFAYQAYLSALKLRAAERDRALESALLAAMTGDFDAAEAAAMEFELQDPSYGWGRALRGLVLLQRDQPQEAIKHLDQALKLMPKNVAARALLARAYLNGGDFERFADVTDQLGDLEAKTPADLLFKGYAELIWDPLRALNTIDEAVRSRSTPLFRLIRGDAWALRALDTGRFEDAERALQDIRRAEEDLRGENPLTLRMTVLACLAASQANDGQGRRALVLDQAADAANKLESFRNLPSAVFARGLYFDASGQPDLAEREWAFGHQQLSYGESSFHYAHSLYNRGRFDEAVQVLQSIRERPDGPNLSVPWLWLLAATPGRQQEAVAAYRQLQNETLSGINLFDATSALRLAGHGNEAIAACRRAREQNVWRPEWRGGWYRHWIDYLCDPGREDELVRAMGASRWNQCAGHYAIGMSRLAGGDREGARRHLELCVQTGLLFWREVVWSRSILRQLAKDPMWPLWIPPGTPAATQPASTRATERPLFATTLDLAEPSNGFVHHLLSRFESCSVGNTIATLLERVPMPRAASAYSKNPRRSCPFSGRDLAWVNDVGVTFFQTWLSSPSVDGLKS